MVVFLMGISIMGIRIKRARKKGSTFPTTRKTAPPLCGGANDFL
jgi:hypothetical protein